MALSRDRWNEEWLKHNDDDEPPRVMPEPCGNCGHNKRTHDDAFGACLYGTCLCKAWIPYIERNWDDDLHRIFSENDRPEAKF